MLNAARLQILARLESLGTVRAVGTSLHLSPSAVSAQLAALEAETGARLLERTGRRVRLTPAGRTLARHARVILDQMALAEAELAHPDGEPAGVVRVAAFSSAVRALVIPLAARLAVEHPRVEVEVDELDPRESGPALRRADVDVAVTADLLDGALLAGPDVATVPLLEDPVVLVTARGDQAPGEPADLARLADAPWAADLPGRYLSTLVESACREAGFEPRVVARLPSYELLLAHVEAGLSVALLPGLAVDPRYAVDARPLRAPRTRPVYAAVRRGAAPTAATTVVLGALRRVAREVAGHAPPGTG
ncbi:LysR family transcriptional regulator [Cellulosimicrobium funkei]|uniref:LysR family transcriptional regulator n=1 Tax=Cellulosimicrobium funkei TaxID=264251 RepID=A0A4Y8R1Z2_9MICO|nr:LysR family transcriptional regulator [Cellulosimicrobium funkei]TFF11408.1 LysR family transcriptional regulator [Cellulosimicrobium funkei]TGA75161.1 LysR family transcriptional regulator [Cellulosimicrobium terreum]